MLAVGAGRWFAWVQLLQTSASVQTFFDMICQMLLRYGDIFNRSAAQLRAT
jgi:hypothetical protein